MQKLFLSLLVIGLFLTAFIPVETQALNSLGGPIRFEELESDDNIGFDDRADFKWILFNNGTSTYTVVFGVEDISGGKQWKIPVTKQAKVLYPGDWAEIDYTVYSPKDWRGDDLATFNFVFIFEDMATGTYSYVNITKTLDIEVDLQTWDATELLSDFPFPDFMHTSWVYFSLMALFWIIVVVLILFVFDPVLREVTTKSMTEIDEMILEIVRGPILWLIIGFAIVSTLELLHLPNVVAHYLELAFSLFLIVITTWVFFNIFKDVVIFYGHNIAKRRDEEFDNVLLPVLEKLGAVVIVLGGLVFLLKSLGIDVSVFLAGMGIAGLVIAFAAQDTLSNFFSGIFLITDRPFKTGDIIILDDTNVYEVKHVGMRTTRLYHAAAHQMVVYPNNKLANSRVINLVLPDEQFKTRVEVGVSYDSDSKKVEEVLMDVACSHPDILTDENHRPFVRFNDFGDSALDFRIHFWVSDVKKHWGVRNDIRHLIHERFRKEGIEIPFPQRDLHIRSDVKTKGEGNSP